MPNSKALFVVPEDASEIAGIIHDHGGQLEYERDLADLEDVRNYLSQRAGERLTVEFEDWDDPSEPLYALCSRFEKQGVIYLGACASYEEPSRGDRFEGYVVYNLGRGNVQRNHAWREGDAGLDERSLRNAGAPQEEIDGIVQALFEAPSPRPR
jgi:hypothetical protein